MKRAYQLEAFTISASPSSSVTKLVFSLAEDFYWFNPSKLPSPIEWVNKRKTRAKDSVNIVWWFSKTENPKADVTRVLAPYSNRMKKLLADPDKYYKPKDETVRS